MNKQDKQIFLITFVTLAILILSPYLGLVPKFAISDSDFIYQGETNYPTIINGGNIVIENSTITFQQMGNQYTLPDGQFYYFLDNDSLMYLEIPEDLIGKHVLNKYQISSINNDTEANIKWWIAAIDIEVKEVNISVVNNTVSYIPQEVTSEQLCTALGGNYSETNMSCKCPNNDLWYDNSTSKVCGPITNTNTITVEVQPTFFEKYGIASIIFVIMGSIIIYMIYRRTR
jgi:hypothetical protein